VDGPHYRGDDLREQTQRQQQRVLQNTHSGNAALSIVHITRANQYVTFTAHANYVTTQVCSELRDLVHYQN